MNGAEPTNSGLGPFDVMVWAAAFAAASANHDATTERRILIPNDSLMGRIYGEPPTDAELLRKLHFVATRAVLRARGQTAEPTDAHVAALHAFVIAFNAGAPQ